MSMDINTQVASSEDYVADLEVAAEVPVVKTKKELRKERKEIKKHKKQVKKEAKLHSAKTTKLYNFLITVVSLTVVAAMIVCMVGAVKVTMNFNKLPEASQQGGSNDAGNSGSSNSGSSNSGSSNSGSSNSGTSSTPGSSDSGASNDAGSSDTGASNDAGSSDAGSNDAGASDAGDPADVNSKAGAVKLFKDAHAKVRAEAKSVTRTLDNNTQYNNYLEVGGNSALAGVASTLMGMFLKANEEPIVHEGSAAIAENFPPIKGADGLTADMIKEFEVKEEGDNYIVTLTLNSSEENPDLGDNAQYMVNIIEAKTVEDAAAGFVGFTGLRNEYIAPTVTATINKTTGQMTDLHTICPSYMKFDKATVMSIINVANVGIGLQYETKWTVQW